MQLPGLTKEAFLALKQTCQALSELTTHLINFSGFKYVLLRKIQSDTIESRFERIRRLSGANYFFSKRQSLESDRKLQTLSLVKYSHISVRDIGQAAQRRPEQVTQPTMTRLQLQKRFITIFSSISYQLKTFSGLYITSLATAVGHWYDAISVVNAKKALFLTLKMTMTLKM